MDAPAWNVRQGPQGGSRTGATADGAAGSSPGWVSGRRSGEAAGSGGGTGIGVRRRWCRNSSAFSAACPPDVRMGDQRRLRGSGATALGDRCESRQVLARVAVVSARGGVRVLREPSGSLAAVPPQGPDRAGDHPNYADRVRHLGLITMTAARVMRMPSLPFELRLEINDRAWTDFDDGEPANADLAARRRTCRSAAGIMSSPSPSITSSSTGGCCFGSTAPPSARSPTARRTRRCGTGSPTTVRCSGAVGPVMSLLGGGGA
jgi:hypothetical protein